MTLRIRVATADDAAVIAALGRDLNIHQGDPVEHFTREAVLRDGFGAEPQFTVLLAELGGTAIGYALFCDAYETGYAARGLYLCDIPVTAAARRKGVGRALMAAVAGEAKARGKSFVWWAAKAWNAEAQQFYRSLGVIEEPVMAYALAFDAFEELAAEAVQSSCNTD